MKSKPIINVLAWLMLTLILTWGCSRKSEVQSAKYESEEEAVSFSARSGLQVPPEAAKFIGLKVADVEERKVSSTMKFSAQVYRTARESRFASQPAAEARASGSVSPIQSALLREGQAVTVKAEGTDKLPGRIDAASRGVGGSNAPTEVLVIISDSHDTLARGTFVSVTVPLDSDRSVASVPRAALLCTAEGAFVYTVSGDHFMRTSVRLGIVNDEWAEVTDGLYAGDQVVVNPVMTLWMAELQSLRGGKACADGH